MGIVTRGLVFALALGGCSARVITIQADGGNPVAVVDTPAPVGDGPIARPDAPLPTRDVPPITDVPPACAAGRAADILFVVDNSNTMAANQATLARNLAGFFGELSAQAVSLHVGVISTDLGTPGSTVPSCANSDVGDDGLLNPIRNGQAIRSHQPWTSAPAGARPPRCSNAPTQYPSFLTFDASTTDTNGFRDDFVCNAYLSVGGCGLEQQLESVYRALVVHNPREQPGNMDPNAGFVRQNAVLGIAMLTDEEDGSVRDCRYAENGVPCTDGIGVYDSTNATWASTDLNLRFYNYRPGSLQDPTWNVDRYISPGNPTRGLTSLKPNAPHLVVFGALAGVPLDMPMRDGGGAVDWTALLGRDPGGSEGYTAMSAEGPISMRQANMDPACSTRVVPACRRQGTPYDPARPPCSTDQQYFALPSRRIAEVARRFDQTYGNGVISSICRNDYTAFMQDFARRVASRYCP